MAIKTCSFCHGAVPCDCLQRHRERTAYAVRIVNGVGSNQAVTEEVRRESLEEVISEAKKLLRRLPKPLTVEA